MNKNRRKIHLGVTTQRESETFSLFLISFLSLSQICLLRKSIMQNQAAFKEFVHLLEEKKVKKYIEIPQIAIIGNNSKEKNSLISSLLEIEIAFSDSQRKNIPLRFRMQKNEKITSKMSICWCESKQEKKEFHSIETNHWDNLMSNFESIQSSLTSQVGPYFIDISLCGPNCVETTYLDYPGLISFDEFAEEKTPSKENQSILHEHLRNQNTIIMIVIPSNLEFLSVEKMISDAVKFDPNSSRTIPIVVESEKTTSEDIQTMLKAISEVYAKNQLNQNGIYVIPWIDNMVHLSIELEQIQKEEMNSIENSFQWNLLKDPIFFGVDRLKEKLCSLQVQMILNSIPTTIKQVTLEKSRFIEKILNIGEDLSNFTRRRAFFTKWVENNLMIFGKEIKGGRFCSKKNLRTKLLALYSSFREAIEETPLYQHESDFDINFIKEEVRLQKITEIISKDFFDLFS